MEFATNEHLVEMPNIVTIAPGATLDVTDAKEGTIQVMGLYQNGANGAVLTSSTTAVVDRSYAYDSTAHTITVPGTATDAPTLYLVKYDRDVTSGLKISNSADAFPSTVRMTLYAAIMDPCSDQYRAAYIYIPSLTPDPSVTIAFDSENQNVDFNGSVNLDFCGSEKVLYEIFFPDQNAVLSGAVA